jgi:hypothetical protein
MTRKTKTKKKEHTQKQKSEPKSDDAASKETFYEGGNDYGGIPDRDLKKNLGGCG